jgi:HAD superfamily hydrolase (TIGR01509 family)
MNKYKYILFDWDGTLVKTLDVWIDAYKTVATNHNIDLIDKSDKEVAKIFFGKLGEGYREFGIDDTKTIYEEVKKYVDSNVAHVQSYPNVKTVLERLKRLGLKLALHTTSNRNLLYPAIKTLDFERYFDLILTKDDVKNPKPDPEVLFKELKHFSAEPSQALVVGDSASDLEAANNAGIDSVLIYPTSHKNFYSKSDLLQHKPKYVISNLLKLLEVVN